MPPPAAEAQPFWFSGPVRTEAEVEAILRGDADAAERNHAGPRLFDLTISLYRSPKGDDNGNTLGRPGSEEQDQYERIIRHFADAVYDATEGEHQIRKVRIFRNFANQHRADILWGREGMINAGALSGINHAGNSFQIKMYDIHKDQRPGARTSYTYYQDALLAGYVLAHEWGHYAYGLGEEYESAVGDIPVVPSLMGSITTGIRRQASDAQWLNFSIPANPDAGTRFENTGKTDQHRNYLESGWETLSRPFGTRDEAVSTRTGWPKRIFYPELAHVAPRGANEPRFPQPGNAQSRLDILWMQDDFTYEIILDRSGSMGSTNMRNAIAAAKLLVELAPIRTSRIGVIVFNSTPQEIVPITLVDSQRTKNQIKAAIDQVFSSGGTAIGSAARVALNVLTAPGVGGTKAAFLLSDGMSNTGPDPLSVVPDYVAAQIPLFTFSYGAAADTDTLRQMANLTRGRLYISPTTLTAVSQAFQDANAAASSATTVATGRGSVRTTGPAAPPPPIQADSTMAEIAVTVVHQGSRGDATFQFAGPGGGVFGPQRVEESGGQTLSFFSIPNPTPGAWRVLGRSTRGTVGFTFQATAQPKDSTYVVVGNSLLGETLDYPQPLILAASVGRERAITGATVRGRITRPDGTEVTIALRDNGRGADENAGDGIYAGIYAPEDDGVHEVLIEASGTRATARLTDSGFEGLPFPDGSPIFPAPPVPVGHDFQRLDRFQVEARGTRGDDHGDRPSTATLLQEANGAPVEGRIDRGGDVDVFRLRVPAGAREIAVRVLGLALDMNPRLRVLAADGRTVLGSGILPAQGSRLGYLVVPVSATPGQDLYAEVSHRDGSAGTGLYQVSAGPPLEGDEPALSGTCTPSSEILCLLGNRFAVEVEWLDFKGNRGRGKAISLTRDTGYFWFFKSSNVEIIFKVLDGRTSNNGFWVFYGALSNVTYQIRVSDTVTGVTKTYSNPSGRFESRADIGAFDAQLFDDLFPEWVFDGTDLLSSGDGADLTDFAPVRTDSVVARATCMSDATTLCLREGRFQVRVSFPGTGAARRVPLTDETGYFWLNNTNNVELLVKVLDGRGINRHFWVFGGSLSDQEFVITVTDTTTGQSRTYRNRRGNLASFGDVEAFAAP